MGITTEEILKYQAEEKAFLATPIGVAFNRFKRTHHTAVMQDTEDSCNDRDRKSTADAWKAFHEAEREFRELLKGIVE